MKPTHPVDRKPSEHMIEARMLAFERYWRFWMRSGGPQEAGMCMARHIGRLEAELERLSRRFNVLSRKLTPLMRTGAAELVHKPAKELAQE